MRLPVRAMFVIFGAALQLACVPPEGTGTTSSGGGRSPDGSAEGGAATAAGQACLDTADAFAKARERCGDDYTVARSTVIRDLANGDCDSVSIRNEAELRRQCLPSLATIRCADLLNQRFPPACAEQIIRSR